MKEPNQLAAVDNIKGLITKAIPVAVAGLFIFILMWLFIFGPTSEPFVEIVAPTPKHHNPLDFRITPNSRNHVAQLKGSNSAVVYGQRVMLSNGDESFRFCPVGTNSYNGSGRCLNTKDWVPQNLGKPAYTAQENLDQLGISHMEPIAVEPMTWRGKYGEVTENGRLRVWFASMEQN